mmetsp:Transcript_24616/g.73081  ORF Transcript_24616/g.73081 Transcript_24616/m.73081 type:complete len:224 (-) Transcript_24616:605-1276(-)
MHWRHGLAVRVAVQVDRREAAGCEDLCSMGHVRDGKHSSRNSLANDCGDQCVARKARGGAAAMPSATDIHSLTVTAIACVVACLYATDKRHGDVGALAVRARGHLAVNAGHDHRATSAMCKALQLVRPWRASARVRAVSQLIGCGGADPALEVAVTEVICPVGFACFAVFGITRCVHADQLGPPTIVCDEVGAARVAAAHGTVSLGIGLQMGTRRHMGLHVTR